MAIKVRLRDLVAGDRFTTLLTQRNGEVVTVLGAHDIAEGVEVHLAGDTRDRTLHADVVVGQTTN